MVIEVEFLCLPHLYFLSWMVLKLYFVNSNKVGLFVFVWLLSVVILYHNTHNICVVFILEIKAGK